MRKALIWTLVTSLALTVALGALAQDKPKPPETKAAAGKEPPAMTPEQKAAMEKMQKAATPGAPHKILAQLEGKWKAEVKSWQDPKAPPTVSEGTSEAKMILGGRFLQEFFKGSFMDEPFEGIGLTGYDNVLKKFQGVWVDSMGTTMMTSEGTMDPSGKVMTCTMTYSDCMTGKATTARNVTKIVDHNKHMMEMYGPGPDGKEYLMMEITYTRAK